MKYTIKHGSIAAIQYIETDDGQIFDAIFMSEEKNAEIHPRGKMKNIASLMPLKLLAAINRNFGIMFSMPNHVRQRIIDNSIPEILECDAPIIN